MPNVRRTAKELQTKNQFVVPPAGRKSYTDPRQFLLAIGQHLTPDVWDAIVIRAIQDATLGKGTMRTKARDFLAKYMLSGHKETTYDPDRNMPSTSGALLTEMFEMIRDTFHDNAKTDEEAITVTRSALAIMLGHLQPEERQFLRDALLESESPEVQEWIETLEKDIHPKWEQWKKSETGIRIYLPAKRPIKAP